MAAPINQFKRSIAEGRQTIGCWLTQGTPVSAEIAATADFDWLLVDCEHSPYDLHSVLGQLQAIAGYGASALVRPPIGHKHVIKQILDLGCQSLIVPMVESAEQAEELVAAMRYPPHGVRGVGGAGARATGFSGHDDYLGTANEQMCLVVQMESAKGFKALDRILKVDGVDGVFIGPSDLSANLGHLGNPDAPEVEKTISKALDMIAASGKASGIMSIDPVRARAYLDRGVNFVAVAIDAVCLAKALRQTAAACRRPAGK